MSFCTIADVRRYARGIDTTKVSDDDITEFIADAEAAVKLYTNRDYAEVATVEYYDGKSHDILVLDHYPITTITSIKKRTSTGQDTLDEYNPITNEGDYIIHKASSGQIRWTSGEHPTSGRLAIEVSYSYGYAEVPVYIKQLTAIMAAIAALARASGEVSPDGLVSIGEGALSLSWGGGPYQETITNLKEEASKLLAGITRRLNIGRAYYQ